MRLAVIGDPIGHSASPRLVAGLMAEAGIEGTYEAIRVRAGEGASEVAELRERGYRGVNVTTPLKEEALVACERVPDVLAMLADSVNVVLFQEDGTYGFNTDGFGAYHALCAALELEPLSVDSEHPLAGKRVVVLGVGPTARAAIVEYKKRGAHVAIWNRTRERAEAAGERFGVPLWERSAAHAVLSTLPPNAEIDDATASAVAATSVVLDANYGERATLAARLGRAVIDGMKMLEPSALASFRLFSIPQSETLSDERRVAAWEN